MRRILRLWRVHAYLDFMFMTRDMRTFWISYGAEAVLSLAAVSGTFLLAERFAGIGTWSREEVIFLLSYGLAVSGVLDAFFGYNVLRISRRLGRGQLDHTLLQPQPLWAALLTEGFMPFSSSALLVPAAGLMGWAGGRLNVQPTPEWLALLGLQLLTSCALVLAFSFAWGSLAFWGPRAAEEISSSAVGLMEGLKPFPLDGLGPGLMGVMVSVMPVGLVVWFPSRVLLGRLHGPLDIWATPLAALVAVGVAVILFKKGLQNYGRTGATRYLPFGHRR
ncbi:MAG: hypothetical protein GKR89_34595 [Candidatus Latescibacteria bacterium]|nr:hypothetical protein [Candidatus Latescibacterota bacterium]